LEPALREASVQPLDAVLERRLHHAHLRARIHALMKLLVEELGGDKRIWLALEALLNQYHTEREEGAFALGFERGVVDGSVRALGRLARRRTRRQARCAAAIRGAALEAGPGLDDGLAVLLEVAWALVLRRAAGARDRRPQR